MDIRTENTRKKEIIWGRIHAEGEKTAMIDTVESAKDRSCLLNIHMYSSTPLIYRLLFLLSLLAWVFIISRPAFAASNELLAKVDNKEITKLDLQLFLEHNFFPKLDSVEKETETMVKKEALKTLIRRELLLIGAERAKAIVTKEQLNAKVTELKNSFPSDVEYEKKLKSRRISENDFVVNLKKDLLIANYLNNYVYKGLSVSGQEIESFYKQNSSAFIIPKEVHVRQILFKVRRNMTPGEVTAVRTKAEDIASEAKSRPVSFQDLARQYSEGPDRQKSGDLGFITEGQLDPEFSSAAFKLQPGQVSDLVETKHGLHIIKIEEVRGGEPLEPAKAKQIISDKLLEGKRLNALNAKLRELEKEIKVEVYFAE